MHLTFCHVLSFSWEYVSYRFCVVSERRSLLGVWHCYWCDIIAWWSLKEEWMECQWPLAWTADDPTSTWACGEKKMPFFGLSCNLTGIMVIAFDFFIRPVHLKTEKKTWAICSFLCNTLFKNHLQHIQVYRCLVSFIRLNSLNKT